MVSSVVGMCLYYRYLSTILFHRCFCVIFVNFLVGPEYNSTCKNFIKSFEQILKYVILCYVFSEANTTVLKSFTDSTEKLVLEPVFFLIMMKLFKDICSVRINHASAEICSSQTDFINRSKIQQIYCYFTENTSMDFRKVIYENIEKNIHFATNIFIYTFTDIFKFCEVSFCTYYKGLFGL